MSRDRCAYVPGSFGPCETCRGYGLLLAASSFICFRRSSQKPSCRLEGPASVRSSTYMFKISTASPGWTNQLEGCSAISSAPRVFKAEAGCSCHSLPARGCPYKGLRSHTAIRALAGYVWLIESVQSSIGSVCTASAHVVVCPQRQSNHRVTLREVKAVGVVAVSSKKRILWDSSVINDSTLILVKLWG